ncbi:MAG: type 4a pilus biogenesis protein PilO [Nitrospirae bacterium]|nr:type 4a pilus biogenesis protein PilO [Nitrospirota bacterium]
MENVYMLKWDISKLSLREKLIIAGTAAFLFYFVFYQMMYLSKAKEYSILRDEIAATNNEIKAFSVQISEAAAKINELKKRATEPAVSGKREFRGDASKLSSLLEEFTRLARLSKVDFIAIKPVLVEDKGRYFELKLSIDLKARYQQLGEYIKTLEELPRGVVINDIKIESNPSISPQAAARIDAVTYIVKE